MGDRQLELRSLDSVPVAPLDWIWEGLVPAGTLSLITGESGVGKSWLALQLVAMVTRGWTRPAGMTWTETAEVDDLAGSIVMDTKAEATAAEPASVVLLSAHDGLAAILRPRLDVVGADRSRVFVLAGSARPGPQDGEFRLERDLERLETSLQGLREHGSDVRLVVIDPIDAYLHAGRSSRAVVIPATDPADLPEKRPVTRAYGVVKMEYPPGSVRKRSRLEISQVVARLVAMATRLNVAVVVVANSGSARIDRSGVRSVSVGHEEFATAARSVLMVARDLEQDQRRLILPLKLNVAAMRPGLAFSIQQGQWRWHDETLVTAEEYSREAEDRRRSSHFGHESRELARATDWVRERLSEGSVASNTLYAEAQVERITRPTLRRALRALGCHTFRVATDGHWEWRREPPFPERVETRKERVEQGEIMVEQVDQSLNQVDQA